jgi:DNA-binding HxlR family transcriptional regulator
MAKVRNLALAKAFEVLPDAWSFAVMQQCFLGTTRFEGFLNALNIPRATLTARLKSLCKTGLLGKVIYSSRPTRYEYLLTDKGNGLFPAFVALSRFGSIWLHSAGVPEQITHKSCQYVTEPNVICSCCSKPVGALEVSYRSDATSKISHRPSTQRARRSADSNEFLAGRSSAFSRALHIIGDRWSGQIVGEAMWGASKFDEFHSRLKIAPNILTDRLTRFVTQGVFERLLYQSVPDRFEYRLTEMGLALHSFMILFMEWSGKWVTKGNRSTILTHSICNKDFSPRLTCDRCSKPIVAGSVQYGGSSSAVA